MAERPRRTAAVSAREKMREQMGTADDRSDEEAARPSRLPVRSRRTPNTPNSPHTPPIDMTGSRLPRRSLEPRAGPSTRRTPPAEEESPNDSGSAYEQPSGAASGDQKNSRVLSDEDEVANLSQRMADVSITHDLEDPNDVGFFNLNRYFNRTEADEQTNWSERFGAIFAFVEDTSDDFEQEMNEDVSRSTSRSETIAPSPTDMIELLDVSAGVAGEADGPNVAEEESECAEDCAACITCVNKLADLSERLNEADEKLRDLAAENAALWKEIEAGKERAVVRSKGYWADIPHFDFGSSAPPFLFTCGLVYLAFDFPEGKEEQYKKIFWDLLRTTGESAQWIKSVKKRYKTLVPVQRLFVHYLHRLQKRTLNPTNALLDPNDPLCAQMSEMSRLDTLVAIGGQCRFVNKKTGCVSLRPDFSTRSHVRFDQMDIDIFKSNSARYLCAIAHGFAGMRFFDSSHLCHQSTCLLPAHLTPETCNANMKRERCKGPDGGCEHSPRCLQPAKRHRRVLYVDDETGNERIPMNEENFTLIGKYRVILKDIAYCKVGMNRLKCEDRTCPAYLKLGEEEAVVWRRHKLDCREVQQSLIHHRIKVTKDMRSKGKSDHWQADGVVRERITIDGLVYVKYQWSFVFTQMIDGVQHQTQFRIERRGNQEFAYFTLRNWKYHRTILKLNSQTPFDRDPTLRARCVEIRANMRGTHTKRNGGTFKKIMIYGLEFIQRNDTDRRNEYMMQKNWLKTTYRLTCSVLTVNNREYAEFSNDNIDRLREYAELFGDKKKHARK